MTATVAFVGLGAMGAEMAANLAAKQFRVVGYDIRRDAVDRLVAAGGHGALNPAEAARDAETLILMVVNADQAEIVLFDAGALDAMAPGGTVIVMATCAPGRIEAMARKVEGAGRALIDAPVSGGIVGAKGGTLTIMAAAPTAVFERARPVLAALGTKLFHLGERPGQGSAMKAINQLMVGVHISVAAEGLAFAERSGIDPALALKILSGSAAQSWMLENRGPRMVEDSDVIASAVDILVKDLAIVLDAGRAMRMGLPLAALAHQQFLATSGMGLGTADDSQVIAAYRALFPDASKP